MEMLTAFLAEICGGRDKKLESGTLVSLMHQVLLVADYSEGEKANDNWLFNKYVTAMLSYLMAVSLSRFLQQRRKKFFRFPPRIRSCLPWSQ